MDVQKNPLQRLPAVDHVLTQVERMTFSRDVPRKVLVDAVRSTIEHYRQQMLNGSGPGDDEDVLNRVIVDQVQQQVQQAMTFNLKPLINGTGVVVHTNLGRSLLAEEAVRNVSQIASRYSNLEFDLEKGVRGSRYDAVEDLLCEITGAEAAMVVNNNAGAVLLGLNTLAQGKKVIISRGELVEIGGAFRIPDVMEKSGCFLKEVGTTNRTHLKDYENAIESDTGLLLKVHQSNYSIVGFTSDIKLDQLAALGRSYHLPVMEDLGSGTFIDFSAYGLQKEPTVGESVSAGADIITFSGDKLLGGPQAGIIVGKKEIVDQTKKNSLARALRIDKLTLGALESTLRLYRDEQKAVQTVPTLNLLTMPLEEIEKKAVRLEKELKSPACRGLEVEIQNVSSKAGGGALPLLNLSSKAVRIGSAGMSANGVDDFMRKHRPPIIGRIEDDAFVLDMRTVFDDEIAVIAEAFQKMVQGFADEQPTT